MSNNNDNVPNSMPELLHDTLIDYDFFNKNITIRNIPIKVLRDSSMYDLTNLPDNQYIESFKNCTKYYNYLVYLTYFILFLLFFVLFLSLG